ncbi:MAG: hypothetical protein A3J58_00475 [Candidatus Sungbacteria bacterium RIFCSPHIGHO2_02_FULL_52_23]|uniref:Radical SAM core domain-containing protein n=1 Tax=Candidatus Sungbacteria bacterium RIFCSPHIGHO2_02_FULL_52_23 TaxID=1802274 RepID=A0A1G2KVG0_9BACT|nr:MAG: hypothetical protein A3J58_00475 [Candidatus Sungbacteria bacterium RIFCSPHIGHO2_02_FULL_52_23]
MPIGKAFDKEKIGMATLECLPAEGNGLSFLWLELTSRCNLECIHCYAESGPYVSTENALGMDDYRKLIDSAASLGCRKVQFIGGEPTLMPGLMDLIAYARERDYELVEVYTNGTHISDKLLDRFIKHEVAVAVSFYADDPAIHDAITKKRGSHSATIRGIKRMKEAGLKVRVSIIVMEQNQDRVRETQKFLHSLGITRVRTDRARGIGRGESLTSEQPASTLSELCGNCWRGSVAITPEGMVYPCIMARNYAVGSLREHSLADIIASLNLATSRKQIYEEVWLPRVQGTVTNACNACGPNFCNPYICPPTGYCPPAG